MKLLAAHPNPFATVGLWAAMVAGLTAAWPNPALAKNTLDGKWDVTVTPDDDARSAGGREFSDVLSFKNSSFDSREMAKHGFEPGPYDEDTRGIDIGGFNAEKKSAKEQGKAKWSGTVTADQMSGDFVWTKKDGTVLNYTLKGSKE
jgi:hypothetical protein